MVVWVVQAEETWAEEEERAVVVMVVVVVVVWILGAVVLVVAAAAVVVGMEVVDELAEVDALSVYEWQACRV